jgi:uncharacterized caspase-like protein
MHGGIARETGGGCLYAYDADLKNLSSTTIALSFLQEAMQSLIFEHGVSMELYIDACRSGQILNHKYDNRLLSRELADLSINLDKTIKIVSCESDQYSYEGEEWKNGIFTHYLLKGLKGLADDPVDSDGEVDSGEIM